MPSVSICPQGILLLRALIALMDMALLHLLLRRQGSCSNTPGLQPKLLRSFGAQLLFPCVLLRAPAAPPAAAVLKYEAC